MKPIITSTIAAILLSVSNLAYCQSIRTFNGNWICSGALLQDIYGNSYSLNNIRMKIKPKNKSTSTITGTANTTDLALTNVKGSLKNAKYITKLGYKYLRAEISITFSDGSTGKGFIGFTLGIPVVDYVKIRHGGYTGKIYFSED